MPIEALALSLMGITLALPILRILAHGANGVAPHIEGDFRNASSPWDRRVALGVGRVVAGMAECNSAIPEGQPHSWLHESESYLV
jgi:hypothetical protein